MRPRSPKLVLGIGNILLRDEGVGVAVIDRLSCMPLPDDIELIDGGTAGADLVGLIEGRELVVAVDAIGGGGEPGSIYRMEPSDLESIARSGVSLHDLNLLDSLQECRLLGREPQKVIVVAIQVGDISTGIGLSKSVRERLDQAVDFVLCELGQKDGMMGAKAPAVAGPS
jgi:hydrogenase maturation protease